MMRYLATILLIVCSLASACDAKRKTPKPAPTPPPAATQPAPAPLPADMLGTPGSFNGLGDTLAKAFDGDVKTFFDAPTPDAWLGRDLGRPRAIAGFRFHPRAGHEGRMLGGRFEVADNPAFANATITGRIAVTPEAARWSSLSLSIPLTGQYWRYVAPPGGYGNVAEVEVLFAQPPPAVPTPQTQPVPPPPSTPPVDPVRAAAVDFDVTYTGPCNVRVAAKLGDDHKAWRLDWTFDGTPVTDGGKWAGYAWDEPGKPRVVTLVATDPQGVRRATTTRTVQTTPVALSEIRLPGGVPLPASVPANTRLLLPRGQTYTVATGKPLSLGANAMVGAYGDGAAPLLRYGDRLFNLSDNTVVADVAIVGLDNGSRVNDIKARGASFVRVEIRGGAGSFIENTAPSAPGLTMVGVVQTAPLKRGTVGIPGDDFVAVYCQLGPSWPEARPDQDEHENVARASRTTGHPPVARPLITGCLVKQSTPPNSKGCIDLREAIDATVTNNEATGGGIRFGQGNANAECASRGALIRGNRSATNGIGIKQGAQDVVVAGNAMAVTVDGAVQADGRAVTADVLIVSDRDVRVTGNPADPKQLRNVRVAAPKVTAVYEVAPKQWRTDDVTTALRPSTPPVVVTPPVPAKPATSAYRLKSRIGVNTNGSSLADLIKSRSGFGPIGQPWKTDAALQPKKDENGWPLEDASIQLVWNQHGFTGDYVLTFTGKATVDGFWNVDVTNMAHDPATNRSRANVRLRPKHATAPGDLAESYLNFRNTSGGVRDVVLVRKEHEGQYLNPDWVKLHAPFGVLRSMDLQLTNVSTWVTSWAARPKVSQACYGATGYPLEVLVDIANATGSAPYICLPIWADDDYCRRAFELIKARLDPRLPAYVESGNENWNHGVPPVKDYWIRACTTNGVFDGNLYNSGRLPMLQASRRAAIGLEVFKDQPGRLRNVLGAQVANHWRDGGAIKWLDAETKTKLRDRFYAVGLAIYAPAKTDRAAMLPLGTAEEVAAYLMRRVEEPFKANVTEWVRTTDAEGVRRLLYECGTEWPEGGEQRAARAASQGLPAAGEFVTRFLARMAGEVGAEEMLWNSSVDDWSGGKPYGLTYDPRRLDGPKYRAAVDAAALYRPTN